MKGEIIKTIQDTRCITFVILLDDGRSAKTHIVARYRNAVNWLGLEPGDRLVGLRWKDEPRGLIDGDSPIERE